MILLGLSIPTYFYVAYRKRFFAEYCIVGIPHNSAIYSFVIY